MERTNLNNQLVISMDRLKEITINELFTKDINASGNLVKSINYESKPTEDGTSIFVNMLDYGYALDGGRSGAKTKGGKSWKPLLINWIKTKGIRPRNGITIDELAFLIYRKINKRGYKAKPFVNPSIRKFTEKFPQEYALALNEDIKIELDKHVR